MAYLIELTASEDRRFDLGRCDLLGREPGSSVHLSDPRVSRRHAEIRRDADGRFHLIDLGSKGGTFVAGRRVSEVVLADGDEITVGDMRFRFHEGDDGSESFEDITIEPEGGEAPVEQRLALGGEERFQPAGEVEGEAALRREYERLRAAFQLTQAVGVESDPRPLLHRILAMALELVRADRGAAVLLDPATGRVLLRLARTRSTSREKWVLCRAIIQEAASRKEAVLSTEVGLDGRAEPDHGGACRAVACAPMLVRGEPVGVLYLDRAAASPFGEKDLALLATLAGRSALAVKTALLHSRIDDFAVEERRRLQRAIHDLPDGIVLLDARRRIVLANPRAEEILPVLTESKKGEVLTRIGRLTVEDAVRQDRPLSREIEIAGPPRRIFAVSGAVSPSSQTAEAEIVLVLREVTEERMRDERNAMAGRLALVGQLAGGIAHDFNNLLTVIGNYADLAAEQTQGMRVCKDIEEIQRAAKAAAALTRQLLAMSRRENLRPIVLDLNRSVRDVLRMLSRTVGEHIEIRTELAPDLWRTKLDPGKVEQVLMNLTVNSRDALPNGGCVVIETANEHLAGGLAEARGVEPGRYVRLSVRDNGCGMTPEVKARLFEPFFTTKPQGKGTGLGLATIFGIVKQAGGGIGVTSTPGQGSAFDVYLPATDEVAALQLVGPPPDAWRPGSGKTVLLVEDEPGVRKVACRILEAAGFRVIPAGNGEEGLRCANEHPGEIHLVLSDVIMPALCGPEMASRIRESRPDVAVLFMSGYTGGMLDAVPELPEFGDLLRKPFNEPELLTRVLGALEAREKALQEAGKKRA